MLLCVNDQHDEYGTPCTSPLNDKRVELALERRSGTTDTIQRKAITIQLAPGGHALVRTVDCTVDAHDPQRVLKQKTSEMRNEFVENSFDDFMRETHLKVLSAQEDGFQLISSLEDVIDEPPTENDAFTTPPLFPLQQPQPSPSSPPSSLGSSNNSSSSSSGGGEGGGGDCSNGRGGGGCGGSGSSRNSSSSSSRSSTSSSSSGGGGGSSSSSAASSTTERKVARAFEALLGHGFDAEQAERALVATGGHQEGDAAVAVAGSWPCFCCRRNVVFA